MTCAFLHRHNNSISVCPIGYVSMRACNSSSMCELWQYGHFWLVLMSSCSACMLDSAGVMQPGYCFSSTDAYPYYGHAHTLHVTGLCTASMCAQGIHHSCSLVLVAADQGCHMEPGLCEAVFAGCLCYIRHLSLVVCGYWLQTCSISAW